MNGPHYKLSIITDSPLSEIWVGDEDGYFVAKDIGWFKERLEPGTYVVQVGGLKAPKHTIVLESDLHIEEKDLRGKTMTRRKLIREGAELLQKTGIVVILGIICMLATYDLWAAENCTAAADTVACVTEQVQVGSNYGQVAAALGKPVSAFEAGACPPEATPPDDRCIVKQVTVHIIGDLEFLVSYGAGVVETVDYRPVPDAHRDLESTENPFR